MHCTPQSCGSISAWAEASGIALRRAAHTTVYLRVGGGIVLPNIRTILVTGLSPRGRRHRLCAILSNRVEGSISAWAEASDSMKDPLWRPGVYLRVGGGIAGRVRSEGNRSGLSPRGRRHLRC